MNQLNSLPQCDCKYLLNNRFVIINLQRLKIHFKDLRPWIFSGAIDHFHWGGFDVMAIFAGSISVSSVYPYLGGSIYYDLKIQGIS